MTKALARKGPMAETLTHTSTSRPDKAISPKRNIRALRIRIGPLYHKYNKEPPQNSISNYPKAETLHFLKSRAASSYDY